MSGLTTFGIDLRTERGRRTVAVLLVDGVPLVRMLDGYDPMPAEEVLGTGALVPVDPPQRVALYECACGGGVGCANVSWVISERRGRVRWKDAASVSMYGGALPPEDVEDFDEHERRPRPLDIPDFTFEAGQYRAAISRAREVFAERRP
ncbi:hypothetical protein FE697_012660 [Mumia zhuanghuii]|uniref:Uncharacterized protein n=2 Tax=Mumia TaxID=1546255 RepID=A0ABW1QHC1_9ACTN|nr:MULTISPECIES: hypothetical protein [Mumia]KAA1422979.1 hypothetical protein FE697_012660 [Mumia zhuanghuii]